MPSILVNTLIKGIGIVDTNISPSIKAGLPSLAYNLQYLKVFLTPEPNSSALPISLKNFAITGFFGYGEK